MHYKENNKESRTFVQGLRPFGKTLPRSVRGILKKNGYNYSEIVSKWSILVGKDISEFSYPKSIKIAQNEGNGVLVVSVKRGNELMVEYSKEEIIKTANSLQKKIHPDVNPNTNTERLSQIVNEAKETALKDFS